MPDTDRLKHDVIARAALVICDVQESWDGGPDGEDVVNISYLEDRIRSAAERRGFHDERTVELALLKMTKDAL